MQQEDKEKRLTVLRAALLGEQLPSSWRGERMWRSTPR